MAASSLQSGVSIKARMMSFQESLSSTSDSDVCSEDCWSTTKLRDSLPPSIISLLSNTSSNAADNLTSVSLSFTEVLLPPLRTLVSQSMEDYLQQHSWDTLKVDPIKKNLLFYFSKIMINAVSKRSILMIVEILESSLK